MKTKYIGNTKDEELRVSIELDGKLNISIGINTLAFAIENSEENNPFNDGLNDFVKLFKITNPLEFSKDVVCELQREDEVGNTPLKQLLDKVAWAAIDDGSMAVREIKLQ